MLGSICGPPITQGLRYLPFPVPKPRATSITHIKYKDIIKCLPCVIVMIGTFFLPSIAAKYVPGCMNDTEFKEFDREKDSMTGYSFRFWKQLILDYPQGKGLSVNVMYSKGKLIEQIVKAIGGFLIASFLGDKTISIFGGKGGKEKPPEAAPEKPPETTPEPPKDPPPTPPSPPSDPGGMI